MIGKIFAILLRRTPLAWLQLAHEKTKLLAAIAGIVFACVLMFMQFGFQSALFDLATLFQRQLDADLVIIHSRSENLIAMRQFSRRVLYQAMNNRQVASASEMYIGLAPWKNPWTGGFRSIMVIGFEPTAPLLDLPGVAENLGAMRQADALVFDRAGREEFGAVGAAFDRGETVRAELNERKMDVRGLFTLGSSFTADGTVLTSDLNFLRVFKERQPEAIDLGLLRLAEGADADAVKAELNQVLPENVVVFTKQDYADFEKRYWETGTPIGFIFTFGAILGFIVGVIITYQVLYTDVVNHLAEYATLKAMGYSQWYLIGVVFQESMILSLLGFVPGFLVALGLYVLASAGANLSITMTWERAALVFVLTQIMCFASGLLAIRKLSQADPADIF